MPNRHLAFAVRLFDAIEHRWTGPTTRRVVAAALVTAFLASIGLIELARLGVLPSVLGHPMPTNHFHAISWTVTLLLIVEVVDLVFGLAGSVSRTIGKQLEIFSLVLLRKTFDQLPGFPEPIVVTGHLDTLAQMGAEVGGALAVFAILIGYYRLQRHRPISVDQDELANFIAIKKSICLLLLAVFAGIGVLSGTQSLTLEAPDATLSLRFFELIFTILIYADVLLVLVSLRANLGYHLVFRNFGYAVVTIAVRLALVAEPYWNAVIGVAAAALALAISWLYRLATPDPEPDPGHAPAARRADGEPVG